MTHSVRALLRDAVRRLELAGVPTPQIDASALLDGAANGKSAAIDEVSDEIAADFTRMVQRRVQREPVSHITGRRAFYEHDFIVTPDVLDPRPDTETLVDIARYTGFETILDLGTGSGCIVLSLIAACPGTTGLGVDVSEAALEVAKRNADAIGVSSRVTWRQSDWFDAVTGTFDLIVSNPPYITESAFETLQPEVRDFEPKLALTPGGDGLASYRTLAHDAPAYLAPGGTLLLEIGYDQAQSVTSILRAEGWTNIALEKDLSGHPRVISAKRG